MIFTAPCVTFLMRADPLRGQVGEGWALEIESFWALWNDIEPISECHLGPKKLFGLHEFGIRETYCAGLIRIRHHFSSPGFELFHLIAAHLHFRHFCTKNQCCGSGIFIADQNFSIPDTGSKRFRIRDPGSGSAPKNLSIYNPKNCFYALGNMFIPDPDFESGSWFLPIPDPGVKKAPDPGSGSATLLNIGRISRCFTTKENLAWALFISFFYLLLFTE